ncbi:MAG: TolC family protein [Cytophagaceae bacterium]|nr:TolC family protein [Cytophagaceae bacterium]MDW8456039.1 TolC family protein [Cytophagaceae bacterium]
MLLHRYALTFKIFILFSGIYAQVSYTIEECDKLFQKNNLLLLAQQYNIASEKAAVIQARIWEQPYLYVEPMLYNTDHRDVFNVGPDGQKLISVQQLIYLGKKRKEILYAKSNVILAELEFEDLLRTLRHEMHKNFYELYFNQVKYNNLEILLKNLNDLIQAHYIQAQKGNIPLKDVVRLQSLAVSVKKELMDIHANNLINQEQLKLLTGTTENINAIVEEQFVVSMYKKQIQYSDDELLELALRNNPDYLYAKQLRVSMEAYLKWQKSLSIPNPTIGAIYDQRSAAFNNQFSLSLGLPLPLWNKNKGNIKIAEAKLNQQNLLLQYSQEELKAKIYNAKQKILYHQSQASMIESEFQNLQIVYQGVLDNFQKRHISLIEFTDFMESYQQSILYFNELKKQLVISAETLNYYVSQNVF